MNYLTLEPKELMYTIGTDFCLEDSPLNEMINWDWIVSCGLVNQPIPPPFFRMTTVVVKRETEVTITEHNNQNLTFNSLNTTLYYLLQEDMASIRVTCTVSNMFGSDNASTVIRLCGNTRVV